MRLLGFQITNCGVHRDIRIGKYSIESDAAPMEPLTVFLGGNGTGKTTLIRAINLLVQLSLDGDIQRNAYPRFPTINMKEGERVSVRLCMRSAASGLLEFYVSCCKKRGNDFLLVLEEEVRRLPAGESMPVSVVKSESKEGAMRYYYLNQEVVPAGLDQIRQADKDPRVLSLLHHQHKLASASLSFLESIPLLKDALPIKKLASDISEFFVASEDLELLDEIRGYLSNRFCFSPSLPVDGGETVQHPGYGFGVSLTRLSHNIKKFQIDSAKLDNGTSFAAFKRDVTKCVPGMTDIHTDVHEQILACPSFPQLSSCKTEFEIQPVSFLFKHGVVTDFSVLSDGTIKLLQLFLERHNNFLGRTFLFIEEPDQGIYLHSATQLVNGFQQRAENEEPEINIMLTTHSPALLQNLKPKHVWCLSIGENGTEAVSLEEHIGVKIMFEGKQPLDLIWQHEEFEELVGY